MLQSSYVPAHIAKMRCQIGPLISKKQSVTDAKAFWVEAGDSLATESNECTVYSVFSTALVEARGEFFMDLDTQLMVVQQTLGKLVTRLKEECSLADVIFKVNKMIGWTQMLVMNKE
jgi:hypothetical protein